MSTFLGFFYYKSLKVKLSKISLVVKAQEWCNDSQLQPWPTEFYQFLSLGSFGGGGVCLPKEYERCNEGWEMLFSITSSTPTALIIPKSDNSQSSVSILDLSISDPCMDC